MRTSLSNRLRHIWAARLKEHLSGDASQEVVEIIRDLEKIEEVFDLLANTQEEEDY